MKSLKLLALTALLVLSSNASATCLGCNTGAEAYPQSWTNSRSAQKVGVAIPYAGVDKEVGEDLSNADVSGSWRTAPMMGNAPTPAVLYAQYKNIANTRACNSFYFATPHVNKGLRDSRGIYINPTLTYQPDLTKKLGPVILNYDGAYLAHSNLRFAFVADISANGAIMYDIDATGLHIIPGSYVSMKDAQWTHINLSVDPLTGHGVHWVDAGDGSYIVAGIAVGNQPKIVDAWFYTWRSGTKFPVAKTIVVKDPVKIGYKFVAAPLTVYDQKVNPAMLTTTTVNNTSSI